MVTAERPALTLDTLDVTDTSLYVEQGYPWEAWDILRREAPVYWYQRPNFEPFWAITKHADVRYISSHPELFSNTQILRMNDTESVGNRRSGAERSMRTAMAVMRRIRRTSSSWIRPSTGSIGVWWRTTSRRG